MRGHATVLSIPRAWRPVLPVLISRWRGRNALRAVLRVVCNYDAPRPGTRGGGFESDVDRATGLHLQRGRTVIRLREIQRVFAADRDAVDGQRCGARVGQRYSFSRTARTLLLR